MVALIEELQEAHKARDKVWETLKADVEKSGTMSTLYLFSSLSSTLVLVL